MPFIGAAALCALGVFGCLPDPLERYPETAEDKAKLRGAECKPKETKACTCSETLEEGVHNCRADGTFEKECDCSGEPAAKQQ
jgi:hypothetical protein